MPTETIVITEKHEPVVAGGGPGGGFGDERFGDEGGGFGGWPRPVSLETYRVGMLLAMGAITMVFAAFTSALIVRRGVAADWQPTEIPTLLWLNTAVLVASSLTLERARRSLAGPAVFRRWWMVTTALGAAFLIGQIVAWRQLAAQGVYLATNPSSSFFYLMTGAHGLHLLGGVVALLYVVFRAWRWKPAVGPRAAAEGLHIAVEITAMYWHFMDGLWIYLFLVLLWWR